MDFQHNVSKFILLSLILGFQLILILLFLCLSFEQIVEYPKLLFLNNNYFTIRNY